MSQQDNLPPPQADQAFMNVSALEGGNLIIPLDYILAGAEPYEFISCPSLCFLLQHSKLGKKIVFDLGIREDHHAYPPAARMSFTMVGEDNKPTVRILPGQAIVESLKKGGTTPDQIDVVIVSHLHWDHLGDARPFTKATFVLGGECEELIRKGHPIDPEAPVAVDAIPVDRTRFLPHEEFDSSIGPFPHALDYFGDGSLYIIDTPGHSPGHITALARTSADGAWIHLSGDAAHHVSLLTGERQVAQFVSAGEIRCVHMNKEVAEDSIARIGRLLNIPRVQVLIAHDLDWYGANKGGSAFYPGTISPRT